MPHGSVTHVTRKIRRAAFVGAAALIAIAATMAVMTRVQRSTHYWVQHARDAARLAQLTVTLLDEADQAHEEGRELSESNEPAPPNESERLLLSAVDSLARITRTQEHRALALRFRAAVLRWESVVTQPIRPKQNDEAARLLAAFSAARNLGDSLVRAEDSEFADRLQASDVEHSASLAAILLEVAFVLIVLGLMTAHITRQTEGIERQTVELAASVTDATANQRRAEAFARQKERVTAVLDAVLGSTPIAFAFFDADLRFLRVNASLAQLNGRSPEEHVGCTLRDVAPWIADEAEPYLVQTRATREPVVNVPITERRDHTRARRFLTNWYPIHTEDGEFLGVGATMMDVTEHDQLIAQLQQAQKMDAIGRLAGGITHDFNNLLTVIRANVDFADKNPDLRESRPELNEIRAAVDRATSLTRQLLAFSRQQPVEGLLVNPNAVVDGMRQLLLRLLNGGPQIQIDLSPAIHRVRVDPSQLEQVIMNLAINAADAMPNGGTVTIRTKHVVLPQPDAPADAPPGAYVLLTVCDTGEGMDAATLDRIFEPFFTTKELGRGTGLGLATVYSIVRQSHGSIGVTSRPGEGSTFSVYLPVAA